MAMQNLTHDQRGLLEYLADQVRDLVTAAAAANAAVASVLIAEAEELNALRTGIANRYRDAEAQLQLSLDIKVAA